MTTLGGACIDRSGFAFSGTRLLSMYSFPSGGHITSWCCYCAIAGYAKLKVFRDGGANWIFVGESNLTVVNAGLNSSLSADINVQSGDYLGVYFDDDAFCVADSGSYTVYVHSGDVTSDTTKSSWYTGTTWGDASVQATYTSLASDVYVNSSTGNDTYAGDSCVAGHPVLTFAKAYSLLASGGTIHCCNSGADFSVETVTLNKSFSVDLNGADGYFYMPQAS